MVVLRGGGGVLMREVPLYKFERARSNFARGGSQGFRALKTRFRGGFVFKAVSLNSRPESDKEEEKPRVGGVPCCASGAFGESVRMTRDFCPGSGPNRLSADGSDCLVRGRVTTALCLLLHSWTPSDPQVQGYLAVCLPTWFRVGYTGVPRP